MQTGSEKLHHKTRLMELPINLKDTTSVLVYLPFTDIVFYEYEKILEGWETIFMPLLFEKVLSFRDSILI